MRGMNADWKRLGEAIKAGRRARGPRYRQEDLAREAGVGLATIQRLESGNGYSRMPPTVQKVEAPLGWTPGSVAQILAGGDPEYAVATQERPELTPVEAAVEAATDDAMPPRIRHELAGGRIVDYDVLPLLRSGGKLIVLLASDSGSSPDEEGADIEEWTRVQRQLRGIMAEEEQIHP